MALGQLSERAHINLDVLWSWGSDGPSTDDAGELPALDELRSDTLHSYSHLSNNLQLVLAGYGSFFWVSGSHGLCTPRTSWQVLAALPFAILAVPAHLCRKRDKHALAHGQHCLSDAVARDVVTMLCDSRPHVDE